MKFLFVVIPLITVALYVTAQEAQPAKPKRHISLHITGKDSIDLSLNGDFDLIEDSCADIIRHGHYDRKEHKFKGKFTDVSVADSSLVLTEGNYTDDGLKNGV